MRIFLGGGLFGNIFGGSGKGTTYQPSQYQAPQSSVAPPPTGQTQIEVQRQAAEEATQKSQAELNAKRGARASLLTSPELESAFGSTAVGLKSLFGGA